MARRIAMLTDGKVLRGSAGLVAGGHVPGGHVPGSHVAGGRVPAGVPSEVAEGGIDHCCRSLAELVACRPDLVICENFGLATMQAFAYRRLRPHSRLLIWVTEPPTRRHPWAGIVLRAADGVLTSGKQAAGAVERLGIPASRSFAMTPGHAPPGHAAPGDMAPGDMASGNVAPGNVARNGAVPEARDSGARTGEAGAFHAGPPVRFGAAAHRLVFAGELVPAAGVAEFLICAAGWAEQHPDRPVEIWWVGDGDLRGVLRAQPLPANLSQRFLGDLDAEQAATVLGQCGLLVAPTLSSERRLLVAEGMAAGLPVIGSIHSRAVRELVDDGETGWLFDAAWPDTFARALNRALGTDADELNRMRAACCARLRPDRAETLTDWIRRGVNAVLWDGRPKSNPLVRVG